MALVSCTNIGHASKLYFDITLVSTTSPPWAKLVALTSFTGTVDAGGTLQPTATGDRYGNLLHPLPALSAADLEAKQAAHELTAVFTPVAFDVNRGTQVVLTDEDGVALANPSGVNAGGSAVIGNPVFAKVSLVDTSATNGTYRGTLYAGRNHSIEV